MCRVDLNVSSIQVIITGPIWMFKSLINNNNNNTRSCRTWSFTAWCGSATRTTSRETRRQSACVFAASLQHGRSSESSQRNLGPIWKYRLLPVPCMRCRPRRVSMQSLAWQSVISMWQSVDVQAGLRVILCFMWLKNEDWIRMRNL